MNTPDRAPYESDPESYSLWQGRFIRHEAAREYAANYEPREEQYICPYCDSVYPTDERTCCGEPHLQRMTAEQLEKQQKENDMHYRNLLKQWGPGSNIRRVK
jgi:hypothetical protein